MDMRRRLRHKGILNLLAVMISASLLLHLYSMWKIAPDNVLGHSNVGRDTSVAIHGRLRTWFHFTTIMGSQHHGAHSNSAESSPEMNNEETLTARPTFLVVLPLLGVRPFASADPDPPPGSVSIERLAVQHWVWVAQELAAALIPTRRAGAAASHETESEAPLMRIYGLVERSGACDPWFTTGLDGSSRAGEEESALRSSRPYTYTCVVVPDDCLDVGHGSIPTMDCLFRMVRGNLAHRPDEWLILANGDVIFDPSAFAASVLAVIQARSHVEVVEAAAAVGAHPTSTSTRAILTALRERRVVMVGQRTDVDVDKSPIERALVAGRRAYATFHATMLATGKLHTDYGVDYFVLPVHLLPETYPPFLVGRFRWDNVLLANFMMDPHVATVDMTATATLVHFGDTYSSNISYHLSRAGADHNEEIAQQHYGNTFILGRIHNTDLLLAYDALPGLRDPGGETDCHTQGRCDLHGQPPRIHLRTKPADEGVFLALQSAYYPRPLPQSSAASVLAGFHQASKNSSAHPWVILVPITQDDWAAARAWKKLQRAAAPVPSTMAMANGSMNDGGGRRYPSWLLRHSLFLTVDEPTYTKLNAEFPGSVVLEEADPHPSKQPLLQWRTFGRLLLFGMGAAIMAIRDIQSCHACFDEVDPETFGEHCDITMLHGEVVGIRPSKKGMGYYWSQKKNRTLSNPLPWKPFGKGERWMCAKL